MLDLSIRRLVRFIGTCAGLIAVHSAQYKLFNARQNPPPYAAHAHSIHSHFIAQSLQILTIPSPTPAPASYSYKAHQAHTPTSHNNS
jgi:hypothetical protein